MAGAAKYFELLAWTVLPLLLGMALRRRGAERVVATRALSFALYGCQTPISVLALWVASVQGQSASLPLLVLSGWVVTLGLWWRMSRGLAGAPQRRGAFVAAMSMSNHGYTLLGFVALALFGEAGLSQATYAHFFSLPYTLLFCFPLCRYFGKRGQIDFASALRENLLDVRVLLPLAAMLLGLILNLSGVARPAIFADVTRGLIWIGTALCGIAIGIIARGPLLPRFWRENVASFAYRSTLYPALYLGLGLLAGLSPLDLRVLVLYGLVPSGLLANLAAVFFDLDSDLTSSLYLVGTALFFVVTLPVFALLAALP
jgi:predicted permease